MACSTGDTKILPSPILSVLAAADDGVDGCIDLIVVQHDFDLHLGQEINDVLCAAIKFGVTLSDGRSL